MKIDVRHVAKLAKLKLDEDKVPMFEAQMENILGMVDKLPPITDKDVNIDPDNIMTLRKDVVEVSLSRDDVLKNAPQKQAGCVVVPKTV